MTHPISWEYPTVEWYSTRRCGFMLTMTAYAVIIIDKRTG
nr:hypothetical protein [Kibdelosporangium sp. MJ126-NF4]